MWFGSRQGDMRTDGLLDGTSLMAAAKLAGASYVTRRDVRQGKGVTSGHYIFQRVRRFPEGEAVGTGIEQGELCAGG